MLGDCVLFAQVFVPSFKLQGIQKSSEHESVQTLGDLSRLVHGAGSSRSGEEQSASIQGGFSVLWREDLIRYKISLADVVPQSLQSEASVQHDTAASSAPPEASSNRPSDIDNSRETVKVDPWHWMDRIGVLIKKSHGLRKMFLKRLRDALFAVDENDRIQWEEKGREKLAKMGFTKARILATG